MSADLGADSVPAAPPNLNLSPEEKRVYAQLFRQADAEGAGFVTGDAVVALAEKTRLRNDQCQTIWQIADSEDRGFLTPTGFSVFLRLIGHAQAGREPTAELALQQGPIPRFEGLWTSPALGSPTSSSPAPLQAQASGGAVRIPYLTPDKVSEYAAIFERLPLQAGRLHVEQARLIFEKFGLPKETIRDFWTLTGIEERGFFVLPEFAIAMHLFTCIKAGSLRSMPKALPPALYEAATRRGAAPRQSPSNTGMGPIPRQLSGSAQMRVGSPLGRPPIAPAAAGGDWAVSAADKAKFDQIYATLDKTNKGYLSGEEAGPFLRQSNLPEEKLAQIWDLANFNNQGQLTREGFAIAMYFIRQQRSGVGGDLPETLPESLIPPSVRNQRQPPPFPAPVARPAPPQPKSAMDDLFGLESTPSPVPAPVQTTMSTGGSNANDPFAGGSAILPPSSPIRPTTTGTTFKPFVPSSTFGKGLTGPLSQGDVPKQSEDLLEDNDPEASKNITGETTELANLSNQIGTLSKQMQDVQSKRTTTQGELNQTNSQKQNFEQRLAQLRALYEKEAEDTQSLEKQLRKSRADTQKLQSECMTLEGTFRDVQSQHQQLAAALQADQQENATLRERIRVVNGEIAKLKPQIEKLKSDSRQQKGLVAINKKQLSTTEGERDKLKNEAAELAKGGEDAARQMDSNSPTSATAQVASPALSTVSDNNPFFKRTASTDIMGAFASPPTKPYADKSLDDVFGPSFGPGASTSTPPPAFQQQQHTGTSAVSGASFHTGRSSPSISRQGTMNMEPPAPPASRQINSSFLPFPDHSESLSSSRQVSPPASRAEGLSADSNGESAAEEGEKSETQGATPTATEAPTVSVTEAALKAKAEEATDSAPKPDPFSSTDQAKAKADFDNAFAAFAASGKGKAAGESNVDKSTDAFNTEFPPISELERADESESESERGGFDDDFTAASPPNKGVNKKDAVATEATEAKKTAAETPVNVGPEIPAKEPVEDTNKSSEQPSSPATVTNTSQPTLTADDIFGAAAPNAMPQNTNGKTVFDDLDDDFEGLEDAKEGSADDDFANISRDDFNPVFDSSPPASQAKSESTAFGNESTFDFVSHSSAAGSTTQQKTADSHDWDAIFAGLDSPSNLAPPGPGGEAGGDKHAERPEPPGRALTEQGVHDDPILKSLTDMGYSRSDAVAALEKYDYNLEKV
ncbi:EH domain protein [Metarhizium robertsii]|uniref:UBA/TS-N domain-containing protein n=2 Tax=Metarhizium robertsii TaxID=568076 RepID=E9F981_METRA|nr:UBA/TS-N domain-containing protein [Metarhizium robertsii ARSEF 23]EFY95686.1 UBA/TS-N domain-containing protein [Metarhizium robertsii ARSEF 23]EXU98026.1 EH domain protein [Metarhizium robertsii]